MEYIAVLFSGLNGGLVAVRKHYDLFSILVTAWATALGGGIVRDILLGIYPPVGISDHTLILIALAAGFLVAWIHPELESLKWSMLITDAVGVALFAVNGTVKGLSYGMSGMTAVFLGVLTAIGGGTIRDIIVGQIPSIIRDKHMYATPAIGACICAVFIYRGQLNHFYSSSVESILNLLVIVAVVAIRLASLKYNIFVPGAMQRHHNHLDYTRKLIHRNNKSSKAKYKHEKGQSHQSETTLRK